LITEGVRRPVPGLASHPLLEPSSPIVDVTRRMGGVVFACFLVADGRDLVKVSVFWGLGGRPDTGLLLLSPPAPPAGLTRRELEVLGLLVEGCSNRIVARALRISQRTAAAHVEHILEKLHCDCRCAAAVWAVREGAYIPSDLRRGA
jgi:DNA-binding CsgD family transcriptional regulator